MISHCKMDDISLSKLNKSSRKRLLNAKKYIDRYVKKHCVYQFSDNMKRNKELIVLLYSSPIHTACRSNILKLGLEYYSGLVLAAQIPIDCYWQYRFEMYSICYQHKFCSGGIRANAIKGWVSKKYDLDSGLKWFEDLCKRNFSHQEALFRYRDLNNGGNPHWRYQKIHFRYPFKSNFIIKELDVIVKEKPDLCLMEYIKNSTSLYGKQSSDFLDSVAHYLNCEPDIKMGTLQPKDIFNALWQCYLYD